MRQLLIISLLYDTGIRVRELIRLRPADFDKHHSSIIIRNSKGNKTRVVYYGEELRNILVRYCNARGGLHILPKGFRKLRQYGFSSNAAKGKAIPIARKALGLKIQQLSNRKQRKQLALNRLFDTDINQCPCCKKGKLVLIYGWAQARAPPSFNNAIAQTATKQ